MYIEQAYKGKHDAWRYIVGIIFILIGWQIIGGIPLLGAMVVKTMQGGEMATDISLLPELLGRNTFFFLMLLLFVVGLLTVFLVSRFLHQQTITQLTTSRSKIDYKRVFFSFFLWGGITIAFTVASLLLSPENYEFNFNLVPFLILLAISVILLPFQTSFEEYFLRGYLMQGIGLAAKNRWVPLVITSTVFGLLHILNPEIDELGYGFLVFYIGTGFLLGIMTLMDEGLELALGFHAANNLFSALLVTADWTAFKTDSIFIDVSEPSLDWTILVPVLVVYPILLLIFSKKYGWSNWKEKLFGKITLKSNVA